MRPSRILVQASLVAVLGVAVLGSTMRIAQLGDDYTFFDPLVEVKHLLSNRSINDVEDKVLQDAAIIGMVEAVGDDFTVYVPATDSEDFEKGLIGEYVGIGAQVVIEDSVLTIVTPLDGSPALEAGVRAGDRVVEIEGESTFGRSVDECIELLMGEPGVPVNVTIERDGERFPLEIVRGQINTVQVKGIRRKGESDWEFTLDRERRIGYVWLTQFTPGCADEIADALRSLGAFEGELNGLVFDLRWNPGGVLQEAVALVDMFVDEGVIVSTRARSGSQEVEHARPSGTLPEFPVMVLLNEYSASASEVFAGALVDHDRALVLGTRSVGKGSVQSVVTLRSSPGAVLKITDRGYYLPSGRSIQREDDSVQWGVDPSPGFYVPMSDEQTREVIRLRQEQDIIRSDEDNATGQTNFADAAWIEEHLRDPQLAAALRAIQARVDTGEWLATGNDQPVTELAAIEELSRLAQAREQIYRELDRMARRIAALEEGTGVAADDTAPDLWADDVSVEGGQLEVRDADGNVIATLDIGTPNLERWLIGAGLEGPGEEK